MLKVKKKTYFFSFLIILIIVCDTILGLLIVVHRYVNEKNFIETIDRIHLLRITLNPLVKKKYFYELTNDTNYLGSLSRKSISKKYFIPDGMYGWRLGNSVAVTKTPFGSSKITLRLTNSQGFSSSGDFNFFYNKEKQDDLYRVIILGGSTVEGDGAEDISSNLASHLKKRLSKRISNIEVINAGVGGYRSRQQLLYYITELYLYNPDLVIFYDGWNDLQFARETTYNMSELTTNTTATNLSNNILLKNSYSTIASIKRTFFLTFHSFSNLISGTGFGEILRRFSYIFNNIKQKEDNTQQKINYEKAAESHILNINYAIMFSEKNNISFAYFLQPLMGVDGREINQIESDLFKNKTFEDRKEYYSVIRKSLKILKDEYDKIGKVCINDISKTALKNTENLRVYEDSGHLLSKGNFYVAKKINDELLSCGF